MNEGPEKVADAQAQRYQLALAARLRAARADARRSLSDVALYLGVSKQLIHDLEHGRSRASAWQVCQFAEFTGADYQWLLTGQSRQREPTPLEEWAGLDRPERATGAPDLAPEILFKESES